VKVAVYAIALNEEKHVERWLASVEEADCVVVADTGSTDRTGFAISARATNDGRITVAPIAIKPFRFDHARNAALALVPADVDVCIALDLDEVLRPGWREALERQWTVGETTRANYRFILQDVPRKEMVGIRIHARHAYYWRYPCHEALLAKRDVAERVDFIYNLEIEHLPDHNKSRSGYLKMLAQAVQEEPNDPRMLFYYGRQLMYGEAWNEAAEALKNYLAQQDGWHDQRAEAMRYIAFCNAHLGKQHEAAGWAMQACIEAPLQRVNWLHFAENRRHDGDWSGAVWAIQRALNCDERPQSGSYDPYFLSVSPYDIGAICAYHLGLQRQAEVWATKAHELDPGDARLTENMSLICGAQPKLLPPANAG
jgi:hypothetical protein